MEKIWEKIEEIKKKPVYVRQQILFVTTFAVTGIIVSIWFNDWLRKIELVRNGGIAPESQVAAPGNLVKNGVGSILGEMQNLLK